MISFFHLYYNRIIISDSRNSPEWYLGNTDWYRITGNILGAASVDIENHTLLIAEAQIPRNCYWADLSPCISS